MKPLSFRLKIALWSTLTSGLVLAGFCTGAWLLVYHQRLESVDRELRSLTARHPGWVLNRPNPERLTSLLEFTFGDDRKSQVILQINEPSGVLVYRSPHWPDSLELPVVLGVKEAASSAPIQPGEPAAPAELTARQSWGGGPGRGGPGKGGFGAGRGPGPITFLAPPEFFTARAKDAAWRLGRFKTPDANVLFGLNFDEVQGELNLLRNRFLLALPVALAFIGLGGWLVAGRALRPLQSIAQTAEAVTARGLGQRIPVSHENREVDRVIEILNRMMDRLESSFRQATRFSADASHELRTPLTIMQGELENALQSAPDGSPEQRTFGDLLEETHRLKSIVQSLLLLAQADAGQLKLSREPTDLAALLAQAVEDARILAADQQITFETERAPRLLTAVDPALIQTALLNLLSNAMKYNEPGGRIEVTLRQVDELCVLKFGNTGPGIPEAAQLRLFERFHRGDAARNRGVDGLGLGLSLAREIIRAHGGDLHLQESRPGWTVFAAKLPASLA